MIYSKYNKRNVYENIEPILISETGAFSGDVMATKIVDGKSIKIHMKARDLVATTPEDQKRLDQINGIK